MNRVEKAIEAGRCALAVSGSLLRDPEIMLALSERAALCPMALGGHPVAPVLPVGADGIAHVVTEPGGVLVLVEPEGADVAGLNQLGQLLQQDEDLMMEYLEEGTEPSLDDIKRCIREGTRKLDFFPTYTGSACKNKGVQNVLNAVVDFLPNPTVMFTKFSTMTSWF